MLALLIPGFLIMSVLFSHQVPREIGVLAMGTGILVILGVWLVPHYAGLLVRAGLYVTTLCLMFSNEPLAGSPLATPANVFLLGIALLVVLTIRFGEGHRFQTTPLDYLMAFLALAVSALPGVEFGGINLGLFTAKVIVLLFSFELLLHAFAQRLLHLALLSLCVAAGLMARAVF
jgi:UDP-GlcNAc:undecaprenyl-phosphate/decaprenyl-phosphate GlcNAc-1-phosphate transferase